MIAYSEGTFVAGESLRGRSAETLLDTTPVAERTPSPMLPDRQLESYEVEAPRGLSDSAPGLPSSPTPPAFALSAPPPEPVSAEPGKPAKEARDKVYFRNLGETMLTQYMCGMFIWHMNS